MATKYIAPNGDGGGDGTGSSGSPYKLWASARTALNAGDTLLVEDGTYLESVNGLCSFTAAGGANDGTVGNPISIQAVNERQVTIQYAWTGLTHYGLYLKGLQYWDLTGLYVKGANSAVGTSGSDHLVLIEECLSINYRRGVISHVNREHNAHCCLLYGSSNCLVEELEMYSFARHGIIFRGSAIAPSSHNIARRCYGNARTYRNYRNVPAYGNQPNHAFLTYNGGGANDDNIFENCFTEKTNGLDTSPFSTTNNNKFLGIAVLNCDRGWTVSARADGDANRTATNTTLQDVLIVDTDYEGIRAWYSSGTKLKRVSIINAGQQGLEFDNLGYTGSGIIEADCENILIMGSGGAGYNDASGGIADLTLDYFNSYDNGADSTTGVTNKTTTDPELSDNYVWIPTSSPNSGTGKNGEDLGATILYRYVDGVLTSAPLWDVTTGVLLDQGAAIAGLNDVVGDSLFDLNDRLHITTNGGELPAGYSASPGPGPNAPINNLEAGQIMVDPDVATAFALSVTETDNAVLTVTLTMTNAQATVTPTTGVVIS